MLNKIKKFFNSFYQGMIELREAQAAVIVARYKDKFN